MDPIKNKSSPKVSVPIAIRFHAGEESVEDVRLSESLSCSPSQPAAIESSNWRKDFLQDGFFSRKKSGSIEGTNNILSGATAPVASSASENTPHGQSVGTWKLIKGKVSQAMEDIKSSKYEHHHQHPQQQQHSSTNSTTSSSHNHHHRTNNSDHDSDAETATIHSSISDDFSEISKSSGHHRYHHKKPSTTTTTPKLIHSDSDSDIDTDLLIMCQETDPSILKKSFENIQSRNRSTKDSLISKLNRTRDGWSMAGKNQQQTMRTKQKPMTSSTSSASASSSSVPIGTVPDKRESLEIESGVEITEEMTLSNCEPDSKSDNYPDAHTTPTTDSQKSLSPHNNPNEFDKNEIDHDKLLPSGNSGSGGGSGNDNDLSMNRNIQTKRSIFRNIFTQYRRSIIFGLLAILICWLSSVPPFFQGVLTCLAIIGFVSTIQETIVKAINLKISTKINGIGGGGGDVGGPERCAFAIPNYENMPICKVPAIEEHTELKSYSGWMNEIVNYDPANYHISMTRSVFCKLDGSILRISNTNARIPKRSMWNESIIDRKNITFTRHRCFDLLNCRIEMCPRGLARKRYFSRKYPIQLIIKNVAETQSHHSPQKDNNDGSTSSHHHQIISEPNEELDFASTILLSDLQKLQESNHAGLTSRESAVPCGDDVRILLFARSDREKEDWFRRFMAASLGAVADHELQFPDMVMISEQEIASLQKPSPSDVVKELNDAAMDDSFMSASGNGNGNGSPIAPGPQQQRQQQQQRMNLAADGDDATMKLIPDGTMNTLYEGLLMTTCSARSSPDYIRFMTIYQQPIIIKKDSNNQAQQNETQNSKNRREKKHEDDLWKGLDQSMYLGPSNSTVWANVLIGRILFSCLNDTLLLERIQEFLQKKLSAIKLPSFMEEVQVAQVNLGDTPPIIHRVSQPMLDERGTWIDADITYEGLMHMTITTKLNLLRLRRQQQHTTTTTTTGLSGSPSDSTILHTKHHRNGNGHSSEKSGDAIYDSNAESSGASSSESESSSALHTDHLPEHHHHQQQQQPFYGTSQGSSKKFLRIVDRITASNLFQSATEIPYIQKAMENMSTKIRLRVDLKGLVARCTINIPPPPSDRVWIGFRGPPRLWISATPAVGDHTFDWSIVTNAIESKLCDEVTKYLVYPNMVDMIVPFLGQSTYKE